MIHRAHDYRELVRRWRLVARRAGLRLVPFALESNFELFYLQTAALAPETGVYISAGQHGDEAGATEGLITWAEARGPELANLPLLLFPCLNPWGLTRNVRTNEAGIDLNRAFHRDDVPVIRALRDILRGHSFTVALHLHEDYDAQGIYLYEVERDQPYWGEMVLDAASRIIPVDPRKKIEKVRSRDGLIRRRFSLRRVEQIGGLPEAIFLHRNHARHAITFETPSEYGLMQRVEAHGAALDAVLERACGHMLRTI
jgi:hypothetical protein